MTPEEIDALSAGRELDALVAEKVMGMQVPTLAEMEREARTTWAVQPSAVWFQALGGFSAWEDEKGLHLEARLKGYSTDITAAWEVVKRLLSLGWVVSLACAPSVKLWVCTYEGDRDAGTEADIFEETAAETASLAICRAALKASGRLDQAQRKP